MLRRQSVPLYGVRCVYTPGVPWQLTEGTMLCGAQIRRTRPAGESLTHAHYPTFDFIAEQMNPITRN